MNYREALEFIGEVRAGISWERFCIHGVRHSDAFIDILNDSEDARKFLSSAGISREYLLGQIRKIFFSLHLNREDNHYVTLALPLTASESQIHKRWKELMLLYHPDRNSGERAAACTARINDAYSVLKNPGKKAEYDRKLLSPKVGQGLRHEVGKFRTALPREHIIASPRTRSLVSKLIIPFCAIVASVILLVMFFEKRQERQAYHSFPERADEQIQAKEEAKVQVKEEEQIKAKEKVEERIEPKAEVKAKVQVQEKIPVKAKVQVKAAERTEPKVKVKEQIQAKEEAKVKEEKREKAGPVLAGAPGNEGEPERRDPGRQETSRPKPPERHRETGEKGAGLFPAAQQVMARTETEGMDSRVGYFISRYARAYEEGDIEKFMSFFSSSAVENGRMNYEEIRRAYKLNFEAARYRYVLRNVQFRKNGDDIIVAASYAISRSPETGGGAVAQGDIRWTLAREGEALKIVKVDYERR